MNKKEVYIVGTTFIALLVLILGIVVLYFQFLITNIHKEYARENQISQNIKENTITRNYFEESFLLGDYSEVEYTLEESAQKIIDGIRNVHQSPILVTRASRDLELCAGFIWLLSEELWGKNLPYYIGMLNQETRTPATAWELPTAYRYFGGKILFDFSGTFDPYKKDLWEKVNPADIQSFFVQAFSEKALFGDIGFLYNSTKYVHEIVKTGNYNSHITKNMGMSQFTNILENTEKLTHKEIISQNFSCKPEIFEKTFPILEYYKFQLNNKNIILDGEEFYYINENNVKQNKVVFKYLDKLTYTDITLAHFFEGTSHVDGLFEMTCKGEFLPINVIAINPRLIEKK
ncbi:MAG: hypothetical protein GY828_03055 [Candidatus Gracilibacteria bacterium]|nr:hypothetical protein [Candidatus Gracilibacteria bacterium]